MVNTPFIPSAAWPVTKHWCEQRDWLREHGAELLAFRASE